MKKPRCGTEPAWELFRGDTSIIANQCILSIVRTNVVSHDLWVKIYEKVFVKSGAKGENRLPDAQPVYL